MHLVPDKLDDSTYALYIEVPTSKIVLLHAIFESYDGMGAVKTVDIKIPVVCVLATASTLNDCLALLDAVVDIVPWRPAQKPDDLSQIFDYTQL